MERLLERESAQFDAFPIGDHDAVKTQFGLEQVRQQRPRPVHLLAVDGAERGHDGDHAAVDSIDEARQVHAAQLRLRNDGVAAIHPALRGAVRDKVLSGGADGSGCCQVCPLVTLHQRGGEQPLQLDIFAERLVGPAPADVPRDRDRRSEGPADAGGGQLPRGDLRETPGEFRVAGGAEADVVRQDDGVAVEVCVAVHGIDAEHHWNTSARAQRLVLIGVEQLPPGRGRSQVACGDGADNRAQAVLPDVLRRCGGNIGLHHLSRLLRKRHGGDRRGDISLRLRRRGPARDGRLRRRRADAGTGCQRGDFGSVAKLDGRFG